MKVVPLLVKPQRQIVCLLFVWLLSLFGWAQSPSPSPSPTVRATPTATASPSLIPVLEPSPTLTPTPTPTANSELARQLVEVEQRLSELPIGAEEAGLTEPGQTPAIITSLRKTEASLRRHITRQEEAERLRQTLRKIEEEIHQIAQGLVPESPPYTVAMLDSFQTELSLAKSRTEAGEMSLKAARVSLKSEQASSDDFEALRRRLLEKLERARSKNQVDLELERRIEEADAAVLSARTAVALAKAEVETAELYINVGERRQELLKLKLEFLQAQVRFTRETLNAQFQELENERGKLNRRLAMVRDAIVASEAKLRGLEEDDVPDHEQTQQFEARRDWVRTHEREKSLREKVLELNLLDRDLWERRFLVSQGQGGEHYDNWEDSAQGLIVRLENSQETLDNELSQVRIQLSEILDQPTESMTSMDWTSVHAKALVARQTVIEETLFSFNETRSLAERLLSELTRKKKTATVQERAQTVWQSALGFWNIELYTLGDRSVTVGKLIIAVLVLLIGLTVVGRVSHFLGTRFIAHLPVDESVKFNLERSLRYFFVLLVFLFALHVVNIPLTIFTFLGGTLAIAVGFGAQNILNNFISGLILMVEKPVRVGDLINVDGTTGFVEEIGARSTRVRIPTGIHVVLPNSVLLENQVVNWTLTDQKVRTEVCVGVAYGTPAQEVVELLTEATKSVKSVNANPAPVITFDDFADSSLNFTVHFWVTISSPLDKRRVETSVRLAIDELFKKHEISIPFPQRDVNFNDPVPVTIVTPSQEEEVKEDD